MYDEVPNYFIWQQGCGNVAAVERDCKSISEAKSIIQNVFMKTPYNFGSSITFDKSAGKIKYYPCEAIPDEWVWQHMQNVISFVPSAHSPQLMNMEDNSL